MAQIIDSIVKISVNNAISTVSTTSVNTLAIVGAATATGDTVPAYKECTSAKDAEVFGTNSALYGMIASAFAQSACPSKIVAVKAANFGAALDAVKAAENAGMEFYHIVTSVGSTLPAATEFTGNGKWNAYLEENFKQLHVEANDTSDNFGTIIALANALVAASSSRVALYQHAAEGNLAASLTAYMCALDSARGQFSHKKVKGVTVDGYSKSQFDSLTSKNINVYTTAAGEGRVFFGSTCGARVTTSDGEAAASFIDSNAKDDWVRFNVQSKIYKLLGESNDGRGVTYDDAGINAVAAAILQVFSNAADNDHQYIMEGYSVSVKSYDYLKQNNSADVQARNLPLVKGKYARMNSINTVKTVELTVTL